MTKTVEVLLCALGALAAMVISVVAFLNGENCIGSACAILAAMFVIAGAQAARLQ